jgi:hypothetical protein
MNIFIMVNRPKPYFADWLEHGERMRAQQAQKSLPIADKLRKLRGERLQHRKHIKTKT